MEETTSDVNKSYVIHHAVPCGGGSRSFLCDTLKYNIKLCPCVAAIGIHRQYGPHHDICNILWPMDSHP